MPLNGRLRIVLRWCIALVCALWWTSPACAHVGTTAVFVQGDAGPYAVYVTVTPPAVVPGEAQVSVICDAQDVRGVSVQANVLGGDAGRYMPQGVALRAGPAGSHEFDGTAWLMTQGSWQIRVTVAGGRGSGVIAVPVMASPARLMTMSRRFGALLIGLGALLIAGLAAIGAALVREAQEEPGVEPGAAEVRRGWWAAAATVLGVVVLLGAGEHLWRQEIARYSSNIYQPLTMRTELQQGVLHLHLAEPSAAEEMFSVRRLNDLVPDHNHLMHLYLVRWPAMDEVFHLHPEQVSAGEFELPLPSVPAGDYRLFADVVHADGSPETAVAALHLDAYEGRALAGDDAGGPLPKSPVETRTLLLPDGYRYEFGVGAPRSGGAVRAATQAIRANLPVLLTFTLLNPAGQAPGDMTSYMGMRGHLAVIKNDGSVFAHIHPNGSAAMAAYMLANTGGGMAMGDGMTGNVAAFPFGFPSAGQYRLIVQMKHGDRVETGAVDVEVQ